MLTGTGIDLQLVKSPLPVPSLILASHQLEPKQIASVQIVHEAQNAPDALLRAATLSVTEKLRQDSRLQTTRPDQFTKLLESSILPLFDFRHMTQLAVARNWHSATPTQQAALVTGFRAFLVRTYSTAVTNYHDQMIEYKPLRVAAGGTDVTVKSLVRPAGAEQIAIDYDMEKTPQGWKIYDVTVAGISVVSTYRSPFAAVIHDRGVDGLIESLALRSRQAEPASKPDESGAQALFLIFSAIQNFFHRNQ